MCSNYWINTNHRDAFSLPENGVRYWVYFSPVKVTPKRTAKGKNAFDEIVKQDEKEYKASQKNKKILPKKDNKDDMSLWDMMNGIIG